MELLKEALALLHDPEKLKALILWGSYPVLFAIVFSETGLLIGFFLPGDSLLVTAGILAGQGYLNLWHLFLLLSAAAIAGDSTGYAIGHKAGPMIFKRPKSLLFNPEHLLRAQRFYEKYGGKTIVLARFIPIIRTFAPVVAGVGRMHYRRFLSFNVFGGIGWIVAMSSAGYFLGRLPGVDRYLHLIIVLVIVISIVPGVVEVLKERRHHRRQAEAAPAPPPPQGEGEQA
ncbi:MAG: DedA family protein [Acidobacteriota bacterium]